MTINEGITSLQGFNRSKQVRVIGPAGEQLGVMALQNAQNTAYDRGLDLVLIAPQGEPPVCRIMDYGKFRFERDKKEKEARKKQQIAEIKEIQLSCHIDVNSELGVELLKKFEQACAEKGTVEKAPAIEGRSMIMFISPLKPTASKEKAKAASDAGK